jgi:hypothetical protein
VCNLTCASGRHILESKITLMIKDLYCVHYVTPEDNQGLESMLILVQGSRHGVSWKCSGGILKITWFDSHCNLELML